MFDTGEMLDEAREILREYAYARAELDELEAHVNDLLGKAILAFERQDDVSQHQRPDKYRATKLGGRWFGEDLVGEISLANRCCEGAARILIGEVADLMHQLPDCWSQVIDQVVRAPLWQARKIVQSCAGLTKDQYRQVDAGVAPGLGALAPKRLFETVDAHVMRADPGQARFQQKAARERFVRTRGDRLDPLTGWVCAKTDRADAIFLDATLQLLADALAGQGDTRDLDQRRAAALGVLANPAAAVQLIGVHTTRSMITPPTSDADVAAVVEQAKHLPKLIPHTRLYVHVYADDLDDPNTVARVEGVGPVFLDQIKQLTAGSRVRVTKTIHVGADSVGVDAYEIPDRIRRHVIARDRYALAPWSSSLARRQDLDHIQPYRQGAPDQTRADNLAPQSRSFHRWKTHAGWRTIPLRAGAILWISPTGQVARVDNTGTHPLRI